MLFIVVNSWPRMRSRRVASLGEILESDYHLTIDQNSKYRSHPRNHWARSHPPSPQHIQAQSPQPEDPWRSPRGACGLWSWLFDLIPFLNPVTTDLTVATTPGLDRWLRIRSVQLSNQNLQGVTDMWFKQLRFRDRAVSEDPQQPYPS